MTAETRQIVAMSIRARRRYPEKEVRGARE